MRRSSLVITLLFTVALSYYVYTPLPDALEKKWKPMLMGAVAQTALHIAALTHWLGLGHYIHVLRWLCQLREANLGPEFVPGVKVTDETFAGVPVRVYEASGRDRSLRRGLLYFHGGGWALGSAKKGPSDQISRILSDELNILISVEYGLYPEVQFPVPYLDCLAAAKHFLSAEVLSKYSVDPERVAVSGDSAGGNLAAAVSQETSQDSSMSVKFKVQALIYPALQALDFNTPSDIQNHNVPVLSLSALVKFWVQYLGVDLSLMDKVLLNQHSSLQQPLLTPELRARFDWKRLLSPKHQKNYKPVVADKGLEGILEKVPALLDVRASPLLADTEVLAKCPKAYIMTCEFDVLRDDGLMYVQRLEDAGVQVTRVHHEDGFHGCFSLVFEVDFEVGKRAQRHYINWLLDNL